MRRRRRQPQPIFLRQPDHVAPQLFDLGLRLFNIGTDRRPHFHHRLVHLGLHPLLKNHLALLQNLGMNVRPQIPRLRIYRLIFLFNPDGKSRLLYLLVVLSLNSMPCIRAISCHPILSFRAKSRNLLFAANTHPPESPNSITTPNRASPQSHSLFSLTRALTIFFISASGNGLSDGN